MIQSYLCALHRRDQPAERSGRFGERRTLKGEGWHVSKTNEPRAAQPKIGADGPCFARPQHNSTMHATGPDRGHMFVTAALSGLGFLANCTIRVNWLR